MNSVATNNVTSNEVENHSNIQLPKFDLPKVIRIVKSKGEASISSDFSSIEGAVIFTRETDAGKVEMIVCEFPKLVYVDDPEVRSQIPDSADEPIFESLEDSVNKTPYVLHYFKQLAQGLLAGADSENSEPFMNLAVAILYCLGNGFYIFELDSPICFPHYISSRFMGYLIEFGHDPNAPFYHYSID